MKMKKGDGMESLFVIDSKLNNSRKNYMVWSGNTDNSLFSRIMRHGLKLDGFINEKYKGLSLYNMRFYAEDELEGNDVNVIKNDRCITINTKPFGQDICIWGSGKIGLSVYRYLKKEGFKIKLVCDTDSSKQGRQFADITINNPSDLKNFKGVVILSGIQYMEMYNQALKMNPDLTYLYHDYSLDEKIDVGISGGITVATGYQLNYLCTYLKDKNVFVIGESRLYGEICDFLGYFDIKVQDFLYDFYEILYKENYFIIIAGNECKKYIRELSEIGLNVVNDFMPFGYIWDNISTIRETILDANLGYTVVGKEQNVGCIVYKAKVREKYKIAVLGGSTTDGMLYPFRSWPEILYELLDSNTVTIANYGISGYNSGMELIKLIRDVLYSKPDIVLAFNGFNDYISCEYDVQNPIGFKYLNSVMRYIADKNDKEMFNGAKFEDITPYDRWIKNVEIMNAVSELNNIFFIDFLQPMLSSKRNKTRSEELLECISDITFPETKSFREQYAAEKKREYIIDLSDIFDDQDNVYIDCCHVNENGNEIIANKVFEYMQKYLKKTNVDISWEKL